MSNSFSWADLKQAADDAGFTVLPDLKDVEAEVATAEVKKTSNGKDQISARFKLTEGPYAGKSVFNNFVLTLDSGAALGFFFRQMAALGLSAEYFDANPPLAAVAAALVGRRCRIDVGHREWQGATKNQVDAIRPPTGGAVPVPSTGGGAVPTPPVPSTVPRPSPVNDVPPGSLPGIPPVTVTTGANAAPTVPQPSAYETATGVPPTDGPAAPKLPF